MQLQGNKNLGIQFYYIYSLIKRSIHTQKYLLLFKIFFCVMFGFNTISWSMDRQLASLSHYQINYNGYDSGKVCISYDKEESKSNSQSATFYVGGLNAADRALKMCYERFNDGYKYQYPGLFCFVNGQVHDKESSCVKYAQKLPWFLGGGCIKNLLRVKNALPHAFNYDLEAKAFLLPMLAFLQGHALNAKEIKVLMGNKLMDFDQRPSLNVECLQTICYGFHTLVCGLHALCSKDKKAKKVREDMGIRDTAYIQLLQNIKLIIVQSPMMRITDAIEQLVNNILFFTLYGVSGGAFVSYMYTSNESTQKSIILFYMTSAIFNMLLMWYKKQITQLIKKYIMPKLAPHINEYGGDLSNLLQDPSLCEKMQSRALTLLVTYPKNDKFVGPLTISDQNLLKDSFGNVFFVPSDKGTHLKEDETQQAVQNFLRKDLQLPYHSDDALLNKGYAWFKETSGQFDTENIIVSPEEHDIENKSSKMLTGLPYIMNNTFKISKSNFNFQQEEI